MIWIVSIVAILLYLVGIGKDQEIKRLQGNRRYLSEQNDYLQEEVKRAYNKIEDLTDEIHNERAKRRIS